jgi:YggT family protein
MIDLSFLVPGVSYFLQALRWLIIIRILLSFFAQGSHHPIVLFINQTTEQILAPIRNRLPRGQGMMAMMDWSPLVALILIDVLRYVLIRMFG